MSRRSSPQSEILSSLSGTVTVVTATSPDGEISAPLEPAANGTSGGLVSGSLSAAACASAAIFCLSAAVRPPARR